MTASKMMNRENNPEVGAEAPARKSLKQMAQELTCTLPIMNDRDKGEQDDLIGVIVTLRDFDFMPTSKDDVSYDYAVYVVDEEPKQFFFAGQVLTDKLHELDNAGYREDVQAEGLTMVLAKKKAKESGKKYTSVIFNPQDQK